jgi:DNA-binding GntR family transcriptional regulator
VTSGTATQRVYDGIYTAILERRLAPGAWLRETELALSFDVSRTVVRQALHRLAQDQVIEQHHNRGARVPEPQRELARHVFDARRVIECEVAKQLAGRLTNKQTHQLRRLVDAEAQAVARGQRPAAIRLSGEFHRALAQMSGNPVFVRLIEGLLPTTSLLMALYQADGHPGCVAHRHVELIDALQDSAARAATEMRRHLAELERSISAYRPAQARGCACAMPASASTRSTESLTSSSIDDGR